jgi:hypothetical protein
VRLRLGGQLSDGPIEQSPPADQPTDRLWRRIHP